MKIIEAVSIALLFIFSVNTNAGFGEQKDAYPARVNNIYQGSDKTFVTFSGVTLSGCSNQGGYLQPSWDDANGDKVNDAATNRMLSILLSSRVLGSNMEVRYKNNDSASEGSWSECVITGIYLR